MSLDTLVAGATLVWEVGTTVSSYLTTLCDPRIRRWHRLVRDHRLDPLSALCRFGVSDAPTSVAFNHNALAAELSPAVLRTTAETLNVRLDWLLGCDDHRYDLMTLDRSFGPLVRELLEWQRVGRGHGLLAFKSSKEALDVEPCQRGALVLVREMGGSDEHPLYAYRPVFSLQSWSEHKQRSLAFRAIWAAWYLTFFVHGYDASESQCAGLREGAIFPGSLRQTWGAGTWHPSDFVVRPSEQARGGDAFVEAIERGHAKELFALAREVGLDVRRQGIFRAISGGK